MTRPALAEGGPVLSYASEAEARADVAAVLGRGVRPAPARVYLIHAPSLAGKRGALPKLLPVLAALLPGAELLGYRDVFDPAARPHPSPADRVARLAAEVSGAVVLPQAWHSGAGPRLYRLGDAARAEAEGLAELGVPVLVLTGAGLCAWPDIRLAPSPSPHPMRLPWLAELPAPGGVVLPTVAARCRAMGLTPAGVSGPRGSVGS